MIALAAECLLMRLSNGESVPLSAEMVSAELMGEAARRFDEEIVQDAARAVFHYYKHDLGRQTVSAGEFAEAMGKALGWLSGKKLRQSEWVGAEGEAGRVVGGGSEGETAPAVMERDLSRLAHEGGGCELIFFQRLREEVRQQLGRGGTARMPGLENRRRVVRFGGLRGCVKELSGARRWCERCRELEERIVDYLRECLMAEGSREWSLVVV